MWVLRVPWAVGQSPHLSLILLTHAPQRKHPRKTLHLLLNRDNVTLISSLLFSFPGSL